MRNVSETTYKRMTDGQRQNYHRTRQKINMTRASLLTAMGQKLRAETQLEHMTPDHYAQLSHYEAKYDLLTATIADADLNANWAKQELKHLARYYNELIRTLELEHTPPDYKTLLATYPPDPDADLEQRIQAQKDRDQRK